MRDEDFWDDHVEYANERLYENNELDPHTITWIKTLMLEAMQWAVRDYMNSIDPVDYD